jgi:hypothetical protein
MAMAYISSINNYSSNIQTFRNSKVAQRVQKSTWKLVFLGLLAVLYLRPDIGGLNSSEAPVPIASEFCIFRSFSIALLMDRKGGDPQPTVYNSECSLPFPVDRSAQALRRWCPELRRSLDRRLERRSASIY